MTRSPTQATATTDLTCAAPPALQRACACGAAKGVDDQCPSCAAQARLGVQPKLTLNRLGDRYEQEADRIADRVVSTGPPGPVAATAPSLQREMAEEDDELQTKPAEVQRMEEEEENELQMKAAGPAPVNAAVNQAAAAVSGGGQPLSSAERSYFEPRLGRDLSTVRLHDDARAGTAAKGINARAYALKNHIAFAPGTRNFASTEGRRLMAHELVHTMQQDRSVRNAAPHVHRQVSGSGDVNSDVPLTPQEMFEILLRERSFEFNRGGQPLEDPRGQGRGVGPAAGGRRAGFSVFTVMQVADRDGKSVALAYGHHLRYGETHAEESAIAALDGEIPIVRDISGGKLTVVLDQEPCGSNRRNCLGRLQRWAADHGVELEILLPQRDRMRGTGTVRPRGSTRSAQRTDTPPVRLVRWMPPGSSGPEGSGESNGPGPSRASSSTGQSQALDANEPAEPTATRGARPGRQRRVERRKRRNDRRQQRRQRRQQRRSERREHRTLRRTDRGTRRRAPRVGPVGRQGPTTLGGNGASSGQIAGAVGAELIGLALQLFVDAQIREIFDEANADAFESELQAQQETIERMILAQEEKITELTDAGEGIFLNLAIRSRWVSDTTGEYGGATFFMGLEVESITVVTEPLGKAQRTELRPDNPAEELAEQVLSAPTEERLVFSMRYPDLEPVSEGLEEMGIEYVEKRCFIATACYGHTFHPSVTLLRRWRDDVLLRHALGRGFVAAYYRFSPPIARWITRRDWAKRAVRYGLVAPLVGAIRTYWTGSPRALGRGCGHDH